VDPKQISRCSEVRLFGRLVSAVQPQQFRI
jgi:hypothetical protein